MRRRLNIKLLASLCAGTFLFVVCVYFLHEYQVKRNAKTLLERAAKHREEGDLNETLRIMRRYLAHRPDDAEQFKVAANDAISRLYDAAEQRVEIDKPQFDLAVFLIEEAVQKNSADPDIRREAAEFWGKMGRFDYVVDNLKPIEDEWTQDDELLYVTAQQRTGSENEAIEKLEGMVGYDPVTAKFDKSQAKYPELLDAYSLLVRLVIRKSLDRDRAEQTALQLVNANEDNYEAYLLRAKLWPFIHGRDGVDRAHDDIKQAFSMNPDAVDSILAMSTVHFEQDEIEKAKELVMQGMEKAESRTDKSRLYNMLVTIAIRQEDIEEAERVINEGLVAVPYDTDLTWLRARLLLDLKRHDEVLAMEKDLRRAQVSASMIGYLKARIMMDQGEHLAATKQMEKVRSTVTPALQYEIDAYLSSGYAATGQLDKRLATVKRMLAVRPDDLKAHESYVVTLDLLNRSREALAYIRNVMTQLQRDEVTVPDSMKQIETSLDMKVTIGGATDDVDVADIDRIKKKVTDVWRNEEIPELRRRAMVVDMFRKLDRPEDARKWIRAGLEKDRSSFGLWALALDFATDAEEARTTLQEMEKVFAEEHDLELRSMRARLAVRYDTESAQQTIADQLKNVDAYSDEQLASLYFEMGTLQLLLGNKDEGVALMEQASAKAPKRLDIVTSLFDQAKNGTDEKRLSEMVERIREITTTDDDTWRMAEAGRLIWQLTNKSDSLDLQQKERTLGRARQLVSNVRTSRPEWLPAIIEESTIYRLSGRPDAALDSLKQAHELQPTNPQIIRLVAQIYKDDGNLEEARRWMGLLPLAMRNSNDNRAALSLLWERRAAWNQMQLARALELMEAVTPMDSTTPMDLVWRSQILLKAGRKAEAMQAAEKARSLDRELSEVWTNLVTVLKETGDTAQLGQVLQEAETALPEDVRPVVLGRCYAILGQQKNAQTQFQLALSKDPNNTATKRLMAESLILAGQVPEAKDFINQILEQGDPEKDKVEIAWARRRLAVLLSSTNIYASFNEALRLVEQNAVNGQLEGDDLSIWLSLCARRPEKESWERAIRRLDDIEKTRELTNTELFLKATLLEKYGDTHWGEVHRITTDLLARGGGNKQRIETWVKWLLDRKLVSEAKTWAANNLDPNSITKVTIDVHDLAQRNQMEEAAKRLVARTPKELTTTQHLAVTLAVANIADGLGQYDSQFHRYAELQYKRIQDALPNQVLLLARAVGVNNSDPQKIAGALQLCTTARAKKVPDSASATVIVQILRKHQDRLRGDLATLLPSVTTWFDDAVSQPQVELAMKWQAAFYFDLISNFKRAEEEYQRVLDAAELTEFDRGVALNNMAYVLALGGQREKPLQLVQEAESLLGPTGDVVDTRGYVHFVRGENDDAVKDFREAIQNGLNVGPKHFHLALVHSKMGDREASQAAWEQALGAGVNKLKIHPALHAEFDRLKGEFGGTPVAANF